MLINAAQDYALRMCCHLARHGGTASSKEISKATGAPRDYLIQLAQHLREAGIVEGMAGKHGGYRLAKAPWEVSVLAVMEAVYETGEARKLGAEAGYAERQALDVLDGITLLEAM
ncbi:RrF2 family transcriptional regulator [Gordonibacter massiliensis (ex Traore et al. 2017)]|uniref:RrF2 family transcriptional regulator n=1 Tax=Gordonibacter massiliensis (ex Traore et al. 2017) TaxID=1841863 RepID=UPI001C8BA256|nr:Rrf2 family transcriptional regulator [Gordonibacter massiliensis (ex Traore et al. 2017)]MBX9035052.1 Rrf2 family transcriptional regulator [Gordonibacter massiliensis (ex Traore et al. 2017)]